MFRIGSGGPVIGGEDHQRLTVNTEFLERVEYAARRPVDLFHRITVDAVGALTPKPWRGV